MPDIRSTSSDAIRRQFYDLRQEAEALEARIRSLESAEPTTGTLTDNTPRWIALPVPHTLFTGTVATSVDSAPIASLPPGTVWTAERIDVDTTFVSAGSIWRMTIKVPTGGASVGGVPKSPDVTTPDAIGQLAADEHVFSDPAGVCDVVINIDSSGGDTADQLTQGSVTVHLLVSVPGSTADSLPHA